MPEAQNQRINAALDQAAPFDLFLSTGSENISIYEASLEMDEDLEDLPELDFED